MWRFVREALGPRGERLAAAHLRRKGYRILHRCYRCPVGEIDLIVEKDGFLVFVEVKTRRTTEHGEPWQAVDRRKRRQITRAAVYYLKSQTQMDRTVRFDIIAITWPTGRFSRPDIQHFESAFDTDGPWSV